MKLRPRLFWEGTLTSGTVVRRISSIPFHPVVGTCVAVAHYRADDSKPCGRFLLTMANAPIVLEAIGLARAPALRSRRNVGSWTAGSLRIACWVQPTTSGPAVCFGRRQLDTDERTGGVTTIVGDQLDALEAGLAWLVSEAAA